MFTFEGPDAEEVVDIPAGVHCGLFFVVDDFVVTFEEQGRWVHFGLTSSDVLDTGLALQLRAAADLVLGRLEMLLGVVKRPRCGIATPS